MDLAISKLNIYCLYKLVLVLNERQNLQRALVSEQKPENLV